MLKIQINEIDTAIIITIEGEVDLYSSPQIRKTIIDLIGDRKPALLIDLKNVTYMDSSGVATLVEGLQRIREYGGQLYLCNLQGAVREVFELSRLDKVFQIYKDVTDAVKVFHGGH